ncbi:hypothetical protein Hypma_003278 [Hypsizygus marmoreus]|uniref:Uncharacterized protein n=1 Tax=Hypsizygus marmoreus TaxID=39966 RepID=A0A369K286_HYPMA|nr:hypothetical protein Hypma_003278 [Hypsizygus marmoreus]
MLSPSPTVSRKAWLHDSLVLFALGKKGKGSSRLFTRTTLSSWQPFVPTYFDVPIWSHGIVEDIGTWQAGSC